jgi:hypothetical protein
MNRRFGRFAAGAHTSKLSLYGLSLAVVWPILSGETSSRRRSMGIYIPDPRTDESLGDY